MKKILVTTDFSNASKAGLRFAIQLATQTDVELVFFHCFQAIIPTTLLQEHVQKALKVQGDATMKKLEHFVARIHKTMHVQAGKHHCVVVESLEPEKAILAYAEAHGFQFICMSTHGAGVIRKMIGTHTSSVLHRSPIPVLVVPGTYRVKPVRKILYASDVSNLDKEMAVVTAFAEALSVKIDLAHFYYGGEIPFDVKSQAQMWRTKYPQLEKIYLDPYNGDKRLPAQLNSLTNKTRPSIVVFFSHTNKDWFDKLFSVSISESVSFVTKLPMLVYRKL